MIPTTTSQLQYPDQGTTLSDPTRPPAIAPWETPSEILGFDMGNVMMAADEPLARDGHSIVQTRSQNFITPTRDVMIIEQPVRVRV